MNRYTVYVKHLDAQLEFKFSNIIDAIGCLDFYQWDLRIKLDNCACYLCDNKTDGDGILIFITTRTLFH